MIMGHIQWSGACGCCWNCCGRTVATTLSTQRNLVDMCFHGLSHVARCSGQPLGRRGRERETKQVVRIPLFPAALVRFQQLVHRILFYGNVFVHDRCCHHRGWKWWHLFVCLFQRETKQVVHIPHQQPLRISSSLSTGFNSKGMPSCMWHVSIISWDTIHALFVPFWFDWWW